ncbi:hypothetical protein L6452_34230 [Arctium lappa]|uniref:Uncharacterized protein n=1 Tax=Arctium lappa TaxID=4217 RepID=A0ACB8YJ76_ARCLA|nr:hypothetical protein L6452_34230 [Arctium lappa]
MFVSIFSDTDGEELNTLKGKSKELDETISVLKASFKSLQSEIKELEDAQAQLQKQHENLVNEAQHEKRKHCELENRVNQKRLKLQSLRREEDAVVVMSKLVEDAENLNIQRFKCVLEIKNIITQATAYRKRYAKKFMASIELEIKVLF